MTIRTVWICAGLGAVALAALTVIAPGAAQQQSQGDNSAAPQWNEGQRMMGQRGPICDERLTRFAQMRLARIERVVRPTEAQRAAFEEFKAASTKAAETMRAACPTEIFLTPPGRLEVHEKLTEARLAAIRIVRPALQAFYATLNDEQKARFNFISRAGAHRFASQWRRGGGQFWHRGGRDGRWGERPGGEGREQRRGGTASGDNGSDDKL